MNLVSTDGVVDSSITTDDNGNYAVHLTAPQKLDQSKGLQETLQVSLKSSDDGDMSSSVQVTASPDKASEIALSDNSFVAGKQGEIKGEVKDQYGNLALPTTIQSTATDGSIDQSVLSDNQGQFTLHYTAPQKLDQSQGIIQKTNLSFGFNNVTKNNVLSLQPDALSKISLNKAKPIVVGEKATITGVAQDQYGNKVLDGTTITESAKNGTISNGTDTSNGTFSFDYQSSTKVGSDALTIGSGDSTVTLSDSLTTVPDVASKAVITVPSNLQVGQTTTISGTVTDQYGNVVSNAPITLSGALTGSATTNANGQFSLSANVVQSGSISANVGGSSVTLTNSTGQAITSVSAVSAITSAIPSVQTFNNVGVGQQALVVTYNGIVKYSDKPFSIPLTNVSNGNYKIVVHILDSSNPKMGLQTGFTNGQGAYTGIYFTKGGFNSWSGWSSINNEYHWTTLTIGPWTSGNTSTDWVKISTVEIIKIS
ncbi:hypothetical protein PP175_29660 (plasmid) [Aneurinibacillus sp. Ricciae_BoGa-3]|uniref:hypothetical protein n=1 Tax=Aneurinibacillus sp. Ricciae_BoGa-3 TaxID=3022697 RepID=UPI002341DC6B|nr:hypothetical protein [Aneurinibacillus sp. Ricciae_BoGa-3]WCK57360.1 hypothetical protein PP175_29660 [Aneurinibacillus sp. Ricciae_BoGa-3]